MKIIIKQIQALVIYTGLVFLCPQLAKAQTLNVYAMRCEGMENPISIGVDQPLLSWKIASSDRNVMQTHYEIRVGGDSTALQRNSKVLWQTGKVKSEQSLNVSYVGPALNSIQQCFWQVRVWDNHGNTSGWSAVKYWQMGLLKASDWKAKWISTADADSLRPSPLFRKGVALNKEIKKATAFITAYGLYEAFINGQRVGDSYFTPGWTSYGKRIQYQAYDVSSMLKKGNNAIAAVLGDGWYRGYLAWNGKKNFYGKDLGLLFQIQIAYVDGSTEVIGTDENWIASFGGIQTSSIYHGETYDARMEKSGWNTAYYKVDHSWKKVQVLPDAKITLVSTVSPPVRKREEFKAIKIIKTPKGEVVVDFGQNLVGWVKLKVKAKSGTAITLTHAEVLDNAGNFYTDNLRSAKQQNIYVTKGTGLESFEPHFTFQGFRYVKVEGYPTELALSDLTAIALYSDMPVTGTFETSNALVNKLQHNIEWGQKGNFLDVPTDCPQRDERLGWTGDAQAFFNTASFNMDVSGFFTKWLADLKADQHDDGNVPVVIPDFRKGKSGSAGWGDASTIIPWNMYVNYGDKAILAEQYDSMKAWVNYIRNLSKGNKWNSGVHYGDWLFYSPADDRDGKAAITDKYLIAQTFYAHSVQNLINAANVLGKTEDQRSYGLLLNDIKKAFVEEYMTPSGRLVSGTQTAYLLALNFDMLPENLRKQAAERLVENIKSYGYHLTTGFLGTPYLCHVLSRFGYTDVAYRLLLQESYPSWLYPVTKGATTIWERWDGIKPDGTFQTTAMNSFNHYAYGAIGDWMYRKIVGINPDPSAPGYKHIIISPEFGGKLSYANAELETVYGKIRSGWKLSGKKIKMDVLIPGNTTATVLLPGIVASSITESGLEIDKNKINVLADKGKTTLNIGSGTYSFEYELK